MHRLIEINTKEDIFPEYVGTPIGDLLEYHNLDRPYDNYTNARLLIGMCMDNRKHLHIPDNFAFIIRSGGANLLNARKKLFVDGLVEKAGWDKEQAEEHFSHFAPIFEIGNEVDFVMSEAKRLRLRYPLITVAPMLYKVESSKIYQIKATG